MLISVQYLRAIAIILVLFSHIAFKNTQMGSSTMHWWHDAGTFGVDIFFIISGYIMAHITKNLHQKREGVRVFLKKRFVRIVPLYWFYTLIALAIFVLMPERINSSGGETLILKSFFLFPLGENENYLVNVAWTLLYELIFYIVVSFGLFFSRKKGVTFIMGLLLFSVLSSIFLPMKGLNYNILTFFDPIFIEFFLGMLLYFLLVEFKNIAWYISLLSLFIGLFLFYALYSGLTVSGIHRIDSGTIAFLIGFAVISLEKFWLKKSSKLLKIIGDASYSIYLVHPFVLVVVLMVYKKFPNIFLQSEALLIVVMFMASLIMGYFSYLHIESRLIRWTKKIFG